MDASIFLNVQTKTKKFKSKQRRKTCDIETRTCRSGKEAQEKQELQLDASNSTVSMSLIIYRKTCREARIV